MLQASTLPALNASMLGTYSNHLKSTFTPAVSNQCLCRAMSQATQPGQSLYAITSGAPAGGFGAFAGFSVPVAVSTAGSTFGLGGSDLHPATTNAPARATLHVENTENTRLSCITWVLAPECFHNM